MLLDSQCFTLGDFVEGVTLQQSDRKIGHGFQDTEIFSQVPYLRSSLQAGSIHNQKNVRGEDRGSAGGANMKLHQ
jgi:hypothetical protein